MPHSPSPPPAPHLWAASKKPIVNGVNEADNLIKNDDEQTLETLESFQEVLKRKLAAVKTLEDEIISMTDNPAESITFEIYSKAKQ